MVGLGPVLRNLFPPGVVKVLLARPLGVANKHCMLAFTPGIEPFHDMTSDRMGCGDVAGSLQDHRLEEDEPLLVPPPVLHSLHLHPKRPDEPPADLPTGRVIAP